MSDKEQEPDPQSLNPLDDVKGAASFLKKINPVEEVKEFMEAAARVLEPSESDLRVVEPEEDTRSETVEEGAPEDWAKPDTGLRHEQRRD